MFISTSTLLIPDRDRDYVILLCYSTEGWCCNKDQNQKVTESPVEINLSLMKVIARTKQCAALERETVLLSGILVTNVVALAWQSWQRDPQEVLDTLSRSIGVQRENNGFVRDQFRPM